MLALLLAAPAAAAGESRQRGTSGRLFAGVGWHHAPRALGWAATLRLDRARARDWRHGGYVAQTLWWATNAKALPYGNSRGRPYVQLALSRGYHGRPGLVGVISQRTAAGNYHEMVDRRGVALGDSYAFSVVATVGGVWEIRQRGFEDTAQVRGQGKQPYSSSVFAGIESTSGANFGKGRVDELGWLTGVRRVVTRLDGWLLRAHPEQGARRMRRGPGRVRWEEKYRSATMRLGARRR